jgi:hypothetical protein
MIPGDVKETIIKREEAFIGAQQSVPDLGRARIIQEDGFCPSTKVITYPARHKLLGGALNNRTNGIGKGMTI